jgi:hypothetical protein
VFAIPQLEKPAGKWCQHCAIGDGCTIYESRPQVCRDFECLWLQSQSIPGAEMQPALRPDRCKVVFSPSTNPNYISATLMPGAPDAYQRPVVREFIERLVKGRVAVAIGLPNTTTKTLISLDGVREVRMTEPDENGMQWNIQE